ncbi:hypothetical protein GCM10008941_06430 [Rhizomicrobium palustre]
MLAMFRGIRNYRYIVCIQKLLYGKERFVGAGVIQLRFIDEGDRITEADERIPPVILVLLKDGQVVHSVK